VRRRSTTALAVAAVAVTAWLLCGPATAGTVNAADYDAFWLWAGVAPQPALDSSASGHLIAQGGAMPRLRRGEVWIVYRVHTLNWRPQIYAQILAQWRRWRDGGVPVVGIQIDFDARTRHLDDYRAFLRDLRQRLPAGCKLGITGLLDWSSQGDSATLNGLGSVVDEIVLQTYQGRRTLPGYAAYLVSLERLKVPFKIGLAEGGDWSAPPELARNPQFRGYVVFLENPRAD